VVARVVTGQEHDGIGIPGRRQYEAESEMVSSVRYLTMGVPVKVPESARKDSPVAAE
jgi:hypothetical protein